MKPTLAICGLSYFERFIDETTELGLLAAVDAAPWHTDLKRRVQHYGFKYVYKAKRIDPSMYIDPLPAWAFPIAVRLATEGYMTLADQLIVNEYQAGQGISAHIDCLPCFGPVVCSITLGSAACIEFSASNGSRREALFLERGSLVVIVGEARRQWRHAIPARKSDRVGEVLIARGRRVSLTFRTVNINSE